MTDSQHAAPSQPASLSSGRRPWLESHAALLMLVAVCAAAFFVGMSRLPMTDPDEVFYAETAREMLARHSWLTPLMFGHPQFEKPPLFYWLLMASTSLLGMNVIGIRLVSAVFGGLGVAATYWFARRVFNESIAFYSGLVLATSLLYLALSRAVLTDIVFSVFMTLALYGFFEWFRSARSAGLVWFAASSALAVLTKGPLGIVIPLCAIAAFLLANGNGRRIAAFVCQPWWIVFFALALPWYLYAWRVYGQAFVWEFFVHDHWHRILRAEHRQFDRWYFYPAIILAGLFPWTGCLSLVRRRAGQWRTEQAFLLCWIAAVLVIFSAAHSKLISYILPLFPAVSILLGIALEAFVAEDRRATLLGVVTLLIGLAAPVAAACSPRFVPANCAQWAGWRPWAASLAMFSAVHLGVGLLLLCKQRRPAVLLQGFGWACIVAVAFLTFPSSLQQAFSAEPLVKLVTDAGYPGPILCNKRFVRGVYFYTQQPVVVMDSNKQPFWSSHPLDVLSTDGELEDNFRKQDQVLCVIRPDELAHLQRLVGGRRTTTILSTDAQRIVLLSQPSPRPSVPVPEPAPRPP